MTRATVQLLLDTLRLRGGRPAEELRVAWSAADVRGLRRLVEFEGAAVWLYRRLKQLGIDAPGELTAQLRRAAHGASISNMRIDAQTIAVVSMLHDASIPSALIKGQARRAAVTRYPFADARAVSDVDLLVQESQADQAWQLLRERGFRQIYEGPVDWKADHHRPALIDENNVAVELHTTTCLSVVPEEAWRRATDGADTVSWSGIRTVVPNATELVWQALSHGVADGVRGYSLRAFLSVAAILAVDPSIDWELISRRLASDEVLDNHSTRPVAHEQVRRFLAIAGTLAGTAIPAALEPRTPVDVAPLLQWRAWALSAPFGRAARERLLEEGLRVEAMLPLTPFERQARLLPNVRRRIASMVARSSYVAWRTTQ